MERYEGLVGTQQRQNMKKRARLKVEKLSNKIPKSGPVDYWAAPGKEGIKKNLCYDSFKNIDPINIYTVSVLGHCEVRFDVEWFL